MSKKSLSPALLAAALSLPSVSASAADVSLVSGVYQASSTETNNDNKVGDTTLEVGGRYTTDPAPGAKTVWMMEGLLKTTKHEAPKGSPDPDDDNSFAVGAGIRNYFPNMSEKVRPLIQGRFGLKNETASETTVTEGAAGATTVSTTKKEKTSLYYAADAGFRFDVAPEYFFEIEVPLFESSLYSVEKESTGEGAAKVEKKTRGLDLYVDTYNPLTSARFSVGMKL